MDKNYTYGATLGYDYALNQNMMIGAEASFIDFGYNSYANAGFVTGQTAKLKNQGWQLMATGTYLMQNGFNVFGKLGAIDQKTDLNVSAPTVSASGELSKTKWLPATAIGVGYMPMQNLNVALQYEHTFGTNWDDNNLSNPNPVTQNAVTLGVSYKFAL